MIITTTPKIPAAFPHTPIFESVITLLKVCENTTPSLKYVPTVAIAGMGKEGRTLIGPRGYLNRKLQFIELP